MTRRERLEAKAEKRREWADKAKARSSARHKAAGAIADGIPFGQPVLSGHHSEKRHRRDLDKIHTNMSKSCEEARLAQHHEQRADGLEHQLATSIFTDDPDAIEALRLKLASLIYDRDVIKAFNARCRKGDAAAIAEAAKTCRHTADDPRKGLPPYKLKNLGAEIRRVKTRIDEVQARRNREAAVEAAGGVLVTIYGDYCQVQFSEKPERHVLDALRAAGFRWSVGQWVGTHSALPECVRELVEQRGLYDAQESR
jgi:hypothetical protein